MKRMDFLGKDRQHEQACQCATEQSHYAEKEIPKIFDFRCSHQHGCSRANHPESHRKTACESKIGPWHESGLEPSHKIRRYCGGDRVYAAIETRHGGGE